MGLGDATVSKYNQKTKQENVHNFTFGGTHILNFICCSFEIKFQVGCKYFNDKCYFPLTFN